MKIPPPSIDVLQGGKASSASAPGRANAPAAKAGAGTPSAQADSIHLSQLSTHLHELEATLVTGGEFDQAKVEQIKQAIRDGSLTVNAAVVADRMLAGLQDMFEKKA